PSPKNFLSRCTSRLTTKANDIAWSTMIRLLWHNIHLTRTSTVSFMCFFIYVLFKIPSVYACGSGERVTWSAFTTRECCAESSVNRWDYSTDGESGNVKVLIGHLNSNMYYTSTALQAIALMVALPTGLVMVIATPNAIITLATTTMVIKRKLKQSSQANPDAIVAEEGGASSVALPAVPAVAMTAWTSNDPSNSSNYPNHMQSSDNVVPLHTNSYRFVKHEDGSTQPPPMPPSVPPAAMAPDVAEKRAMLEAFYQKHSPAQVAMVGTIMNAYTVQEIQESCMQKYGADPFQPAPPPAPSSTGRKKLPDI
ncbi:hypothetical protein CYMTET_34620, partial [Cymbomonas tetramitiformis]